MKRFIVLSVLVLSLALTAGASAMAPPANEDGGGGGYTGYCYAGASGMLQHLSGPVYGSAWYICDRPACGWYNWSPYYGAWFYNQVGIGGFDCKYAWSFTFLWY